MNHSTGPTQPPRPRPDRRSAWTLLRPRQWAKSVFVLVGPVYGLTEPGRTAAEVLPGALAAAAAFALVSSACYIFNDILDAPRDRLHPRKKHRPIASGAVAPGPAWGIAASCFAAGLAVVVAMGAAWGWSAAWWTLACLLAYAGNVTLYSLVLKHVVMADVISLSMGFVLRVLGGCAAAGIPPTTYLLNVVFFLAMFLSFCKRLGERRVMARAGGDAHQVRAVQQAYTDDLLRMSVVVTAVATLATYAGYIQAHEAEYFHGFNVLWLTIIPATYGLLRAIVLVERGDYDDPTELASRDWQMQAAVVVFGAVAAAVVLWGRTPG
ncbi:MAG: UbiA prenyltransferase family protein [Phycisphaeraceae bacterium]|nr:MAG: UbiA prenyltransferase family protein [Phycisphaeraceae bacterium]